MTTALKVLALVAGLGLVWITLASAVRTVVLPRAAFSRLTRVVFMGLRRMLVWTSRNASDYESHDSTLSLLAPIGLLVLPGAWATGLIFGAGLIFWGTGELSFGSSLVLSGSSFTTLGFVEPDSGLHYGMAIAEGLMGLIMVALLISYLPSIYGAFSRREIAVAGVALKTGGSMHGPDLVFDFAKRGCIDRLDDAWGEWERWFIELGETHTSEAALVFLRSPRHDRSWLTAAATMLDAASLRQSVLTLPFSSSAETMAQAGVDALGDIGTFFHVETQTVDTNQLSVTREEFDLAMDKLASVGAPLLPDRDQAWVKFSTRRARYEAALLGLCSLVLPPAAAWSSDRPAPHSTNGILGWSMN